MCIHVRTFVTLLKQQNRILIHRAKTAFLLSVTLKIKYYLCVLAATPLEASSKNLWEVVFFGECGGALLQNSYKPS